MSLLLFYEEPESDRWLPFDRHPRRVLRRILRGKPQPGGHQRVFLNLCAGLERIGIQYRVNDYRFAKKHPTEVVGIVGGSFVLDKLPWKNPILFGAAVYAHPIDDPLLLRRLPVKKVLVPGEWMRKMCEPVWGEAVIVWPVGIDTERWKPNLSKPKQFDFLLYDKVRWHHEQFEDTLIEPIRNGLNTQRLTFAEIRYGFYREEDFLDLLGRCRAMIFLCEHETQGIAYQQALSCGIPILTWDRGGYWQDPAYFPQKVQFSPVTSVPYWDDRCGVKFKEPDDFPPKLEEFLDKLNGDRFAPRDYILENLTLEHCARKYADILAQVQNWVA